MLKPRLYFYVFFVLSIFIWGVTGDSFAQVSSNQGEAGGGAIRIGASTTTCDTAAEGAIRYNTTSKLLEFCNGAGWTPLRETQGTSAVSAPSGVGYFVMTHTTRNGNLGGISGANTRCLTELGTTNTAWMGYTTANSNGQITAQKVRAWVCDQDVCNNLMPLTTYYFAYANNGTIGGASFTTDSSGRAPLDSANWSGSTYFGGSYNYWSNMGTSSSTTSAGTPAGGIYSQWKHCSNWASSSSGQTGNVGATNNTDENRWESTQLACNGARRFICFVNP